MTAALREWILGLCGAALVCALALAVCPKGRVCAVLRVVCGAVMAIALLKPVIGIDFAAYSEALEKYRTEAEAAAGSVRDRKDILSRTIIEDECAAYILDKAAERNVALSAVKVRAVWSEDGFWYPYEATLSGPGAEKGNDMLAEIIEADLGVPRDRQVWEADGG
jgi:stage III sporulation protein AF